MGGMGTFELVSRMPGVFAKAFPICGGAEPGLANRLGGTSWFVYHGLKDDVVSHTFSKNMVKAMRKKYQGKTDPFPRCQPQCLGPSTR